LSSFFGFSFLRSEPNIRTFQHFSGVVDTVPSYNIDTILFSGNTVFSQEYLLQHFASSIKVQLSEPIIENCIEQLLQLYENNGYPFTSVSVANISLLSINNEERISIELEINEGQIVYIEQYSIEGNKKTNRDIILRELRMNNGELYNQTKINRIEKNLRRLNIFSSVNKPQLLLDNNGGNLFIKVEEGSFNNFNGIIGYVPSTNNQHGIVTGQIDISMRNLFGTARKATIHWQRESELTQEIALRYSEPWLFNIPLSAIIGFAQRKQDSTFVQRVTDVNTDFLFNESFSLGTIFSYEQTLPSLTTTSSVFSNTIITGGIQAQFDSRDDILSPTNGGLYHVQIEWGNKTIASSRFSLQRLFTNVEQYFSPTTHQVLSVALHTKEIKSTKLEFSDLFRFGGATTIRGYREKQFLASSIVWSNTEYRFLFSQQSFFFGFFDAGYYSRSALAPFLFSTKEFLFGYGAGVRLETRVGLLGVSFALGKGDTFSQMKIHIQLINQF